MLSQAFWAFVEDQESKGAYEQHGDDADHQRRRGKAETLDQQHPQRRKDHATQTGAVVGLAQGLGSFLDVPRRDQGINGRGTQCHPTDTRADGAGIQHP
ncbi:hypothetical protein D3C78_1418130 [compost metagenome]